MRDNLIPNALQNCSLNGSKLPLGAIPSEQHSKFRLRGLIDFDEAQRC